MSSESPWTPTSDEDRAAVRAELERILADPTFSNSKRYPALLQHVVDRTLEGQSEDLRERVLGVEVFGREPNYDSNVDPVVRVTAGEIRRRLRDYYSRPGNDSRIRIVLPKGAYVPEFLPLDGPPVTSFAPAPARHRRLSLVLLPVVALIITIFWMRPWASETALEEFWAPFWGNADPVLLCVAGQDDTPPESGAADPAASPTVGVYLRWMDRIAFSDALTLSRLTGLLQTHGTDFEIRRANNVTLADIRGRPVALIGGFNNEWTGHLVKDLRFSFEFNSTTSDLYIKDQDDPDHRRWKIDAELPYADVTEDYALVSRFVDSASEQFVVIAAGLGRDGTLAAGEFLTNPVYLQEFAREAPSGWERMNLQIVISAEVVNGSPGPPRILATHSW